VIALTVRTARAEQPEVWNAYRGKIVFSDVLIAPASQFASGQTMLAALRRFERPVVEGRDGFWRFHFVAFLDPAPPSPALRIVATDVTDPKSHHEVRTFEIAGEPGSRELRVGDFVLTDAMGFEHGHKYELAVVGGGDEQPAPGRARKADAYARGVVTLR
jgi:hypothetical protein